MDKISRSLTELRKKRFVKRAKNAIFLQSWNSLMLDTFLFDVLVNFGQCLKPNNKSASVLYANEINAKSLFDVKTT